jgi:hypothetical protein
LAQGTISTTEGVTFRAFVEWWKEATGILDADIPVLLDEGAEVIFMPPCLFCVENHHR